MATLPIMLRQNCLGAGKMKTHIFMICALNMNWSCCCSVAFLLFLWNPFVFKLYIIPCFTLLKVIIYCKRCQCLTDLVKHKLPQNRAILLKGRFTSLVGNTKTQWLPSFPTNVFADWTRNRIIVLQVFQPIGSFVGVYFGYPWGRALWCSAFKYTSLFCPVIVVQANLIHFQSQTSGVIKDPSGIASVLWVLRQPHPNLRCPLVKLFVLTSLIHLITMLNTTFYACECMPCVSSLENYPNIKKPRDCMLNANEGTSNKVHCWKLNPGLFI